MFCYVFVLAGPGCSLFFGLLFVFVRIRSLVVGSNGSVGGRSCLLWRLVRLIRGNLFCGFEPASLLGPLTIGFLGRLLLLISLLLANACRAGSRFPSRDISVWFS